MAILQYVMGGILVAMALALVVLVLLQSGKDKRLSGSIAGGTETYYGQNKGKSNEKKLFIATTILSILFVALVVVLYVLVARYNAA
ncbi:MAG: preprotein translocase subunit SecG [Clostridia bacterium]|nr:preprotein translocase subunit SecG [Clostridia bacterium]